VNTATKPVSKIGIANIVAALAVATAFYLLVQSYSGVANPDA